MFWCNVLVSCSGIVFWYDAEQCSSMMRTSGNVFLKCCQKHLTTRGPVELKWWSAKIFSTSPKLLLKSSTKDDSHFENSEIMLGDFQERLLWVLPSNPHPRLKKLVEARSENQGFPRFREKDKTHLDVKRLLPSIVQKKTWFPERKTNWIFPGFGKSITILC